MTEHLFTSDSEQSTREFGIRIGRAIQPGTVVALIGTLGSGKTRLTQAIAAGLEITQPVVSPTYTLCVPYSGRVALLHMDAYRIKHPEEVDELDLFDLVNDGTVLIVEWADRVRQQLPDIDLSIEITPTSHESRQFVSTAHSPTGQQLLSLILTSWPQDS